MSHELPYTSPDYEAPHKRSRRQLIKDVGLFAAETVVYGTAMGVVGVEGKRRVDSYLTDRAYEKEEQEIENLLVYIDALCDDHEEIPWIPDTWEEGVAIYSEVGYSEYYAEKAGLSLLDTEEALFATENAQSVDEVIEAFDVLTRQFGADATLAGNWRFPEDTTYGRAEGQSDLGTLKHRFSQMISQLGHIPKELFEASGVTNIHFTEFTSSPVKTASGTEAVVHGKAWLNGEGRMAISLDNVYAGHANEFTVLHEIGHLLDETLLGGASRSYNDTHFDDLNELDFDYLGVIPDEVEAQGFVREYSAYSIWEDKAVIFENMLSGVDFNLARSSDPILRRKYRLQLARLEYTIPNIAPYLLLHGYHGGANPRNPYGAFSDSSPAVIV